MMRVRQMIMNFSEVRHHLVASGLAARRKEPLFKFRISHRIQFHRSQVEFFSLAEKSEYTSFADLAEPSDFTE